MPVNCKFVDYEAMDTWVKQLITLNNNLIIARTKTYVKPYIKV